jgi:hypothetical protein
MIEALKKKLNEEVSKLHHELTVTLPAEIRRAVEMGDLRENSEYRPRSSASASCRRGSASSARA